jgi:hypothetical protein
MIWLVGRLATGVRGTERITSGAVAVAGLGTGVGAAWDAEARTGLGSATGSIRAVSSDTGGRDTGEAGAGEVPPIPVGGTGCGGAAGEAGGTGAGTDRVLADEGLAPLTCAAVGTVWFAKEVRLLVEVQPGNPIPQTVASARGRIRKRADKDRMTGKRGVVLAVSKRKSNLAPLTGKTNTLFKRYWNFWVRNPFFLRKFREISGNPPLRGTVSGRFP